jgi:hypothetical protein
MFFVSASDDKTVKVWDAARLERNVTSKPRHSYSQHHAKVKCVCMLEGVHCFASAAEDGSIHVVRVNVSQTGTLPKYGKLQAVREYRLEHVGEYVTCMIHFNSGMFHLPAPLRSQSWFFLELMRNFCLFRAPGAPHDCDFYASIRCRIQSHLRHHPLSHLRIGFANDASAGNYGKPEALWSYYLPMC